VAAAEVSVLGPTVVTVGGEPTELRPAERVLLASLVLHRDRAVSPDLLIDELWRDPPTSARKSLQNHVVRLRRAAGEDVVETEAHGYRLGAAVRTDLDIVRELAFDPILASTAGADDVAGALGRWRGEPFADLGDGATVVAERARLKEVRRTLEDQLAGALLAARRDAEAVELLEALIADDPYREHRWELLTVARYRTGRRRDALRTVQDARDALGGVGLDPGSRLLLVEQQVLADDPQLLSPVAEPAADSADAGFVGRQREQELLRDLFDRAKAGATVLGLVLGPAGVGKTALVQRVGANLGERAVVLWGRCDPEPGLPLAPFVEAVEQLAAVDPDRVRRGLALAPGLAALSPRLAALDPADSSPYSAEGRGALFDAIVGILGAPTGGVPLVLVLDDLHLALPTTRRIVAMLLAKPERLLVLATARRRPDDLEGDEVEEVHLGPLDVDEVTQHLAALGPGAESAGPLVQAWTGGNAFFVREAVRALRTEGWLRRTPTGSVSFETPTSPPDALTQLLRARLDRLPAVTVSALRAAAVLGTRFRADDVAAIAGPAAADALHDAVEHGLVTVADAPLGSFAFAHLLVREALAGSIPAGERLELDEAAARAIEARGGPAGLVANHRLAAATLDPAGAVAAARDAADADLGAYAYEDAAERYAAAGAVAADLLGDARLACELAVLEGSARRQAGDPRSVQILLRASDEARRLDDGDLLGQSALALCRLGQTSMTGLTDERAAALAEEALVVTKDPALRAEVASAATQVYAMGDRAERARELFDEAEVTARAIGDEMLLATVLPNAYLSLGDPAELERREALGEEVVALGRRLEDPVTEWEGLHLRFSSQLQRADPGLRATHARLSTIADIVREATRHWETDYLRAAVQHIDGDLDGAEATTNETMARWGGAVSPSRAFAVYGVQLIGIRLDQGRYGELTPALADLVRDQPGIPGWRVALALGLAESSELDEARKLLDDLAGNGFAAVPHDYSRTSVLALAAQASAVAEHAGAAARAVELLAPWSGRLTWVGTCTFGLVDLYLAQAARVLGDDAAVERHLAAAESTATALSAPAMLARIEQERSR
jgi:DNA-binding SARP family transcriptional activator